MAITFGTWFFLVDRIELASVSFALVGAVLAFLYYNVTPAKIFMGDTGSLFVGIVAAILAISFIEYHPIIFYWFILIPTATTLHVIIVISGEEVITTFSFLIMFERTGTTTRDDVVVAIIAHCFG